MGKMENKLAEIERKAAAAVGAEVVEPKETTEMIEGHLDVGQLEEMTVKQLTQLATDMGLEVKKGSKKSDLVKLIHAEPVQVPKEAVEEPGVEGQEDQELPEKENPDQDDPGDNGAAESQEGDKEKNVRVEFVSGCALVTFTGLVNLRDGNMNIVGHAMQGQKFPVVAKKMTSQGAWYIVEDQAGKAYMISEDVVKIV